MNMNASRWFALCGWLLACLINFAGMHSALAQADASAAKYPERAIRFIVPFPPGAANDFLARAVGKQLAERLGQPVVVENHGGAGGTLGTAMAARSEPDGYTIVLVPASHAINQTLYGKPPFDAIKDFAPIILVASGPYVLTVNPSLPVKSVKELIALAKAKPGHINFGSAGIGNATHLIGELFNSMAGTDIQHVPFRGTGPALLGVIGGQVQMSFGTVSATKPQIEAKKVRALAVTSLKRSAALPDVPTLDEAGLPGFNAIGWWGILAPAGTPPAIVEKLNGEIGKILARDDMRQLLEKAGFDVEGGSSAQFAQFIKDEVVKWGKVVKSSGAKIN